MLASCTKSNTSGSQQTNNSSLSSSIRDYGPQSQLIDSFTYDSNHRVATLAFYAFDTTSGSPAADSQFVQFSFGPNATLPASYTRTDAGYGISNEVHELSFDAQNRITKDTSSSGFAAYFSYPGNNIAITVIFGRGSQNYLIDTMFLSGGNVYKEHIYLPNSAGTADSLNAAPIYNFASYANPAYNAELSSAVGPLLYVCSLNAYAGYGDFISKNIVDKVSGIGDGIPLVGGLSLTPVADAKGKVVELLGNSGGQGNYRYIFSYY